MKEQRPAEPPEASPSKPERSWGRVRLPDLASDATDDEIKKAYHAAVAEMSRNGMREKAARGGFPHRAPVGYLNAIGPGGERTVEVDPVLGPLMRRAFELAADGDSALTVSRKLHPLGLAGRKGRPVPRETIRRALRNPFYLGKIRHCGEVLPGVHEPLIGLEIFKRTQERFVAYPASRSTQTG